MLKHPLKSIKSQLILALLCFACFLWIQDRDGGFLAMAIVSVSSAVFVEAAVNYLKARTFRFSESAVITGLIIGYVLSSSEAWWVFVLASSLAVLSKYLIRFHGKHIFNPAAFGIFLCLVLLGASSQWKGTYDWYFLLPFGLYISYKIRKIELLAGYAVASLGLFGIQAYVQGAPLAHVFGYMSYFYIFVMLIEPKTTPLKPAAKFVFGAGVASLIFIFTELGVACDVELLSLLVMNLTVPVMK